MKRKHVFLSGLVVLMLITWTSVVLAGDPLITFAQTVRQATERFQDVETAKQAGYSLLYGCVSNTQAGAMGIHFVNSTLVSDGELDVQQPEALIYEQNRDKLHLVAVEYVVIADAWNAKHQTPPVLLGQLFNYVSSPNRYGLPAFYELHVWAWKNNPSGVFADWNPQVSCESYTDDLAQSEEHAETAELK